MEVGADTGSGGLDRRRRRIAGGEKRSCAGVAKESDTGKRRELDIKVI